MLEKVMLVYTYNKNFIYGFDIRFGVARPSWLKKSSITIIEPYRMEEEDKLFNEAFDNYGEYVNTICSSVQVRGKWYLVAKIPGDLFEDLE